MPTVEDLAEVIRTSVHQIDTTSIKVFENKVFFVCEEMQTFEVLAEILPDGKVLEDLLRNDGYIYEDLDTYKLFHQGAPEFGTLVADMKDWRELNGH